MESPGISWNFDFEFVWQPCFISAQGTFSFIFGECVLLFAKFDTFQNCHWTRFFTYVKM